MQYGDMCVCIHVHEECEVVCLSVFECVSACMYVECAHYSLNVFGMCVACVYYV